MSTKKVGARQGSAKTGGNSVHKTFRISRKKVSGKFINKSSATVRAETTVVERINRLEPLSEKELDATRKRAQRALKAGDAAARDTMRLIATIEDREDRAAIAAADSADAWLPEDAVRRLVAGESPLRVYRQARDMTQPQLAEALDVSQGFISGLENGTKKWTAQRLAAAAEVLDVSMEDLI